jgi:hypothetical protein
MKHVFYIDTLRDSYELDPQALDPGRYAYKVSTDAEDVFRVMNVVTGDADLELPLTLRCRSMSVGDVYVEDGVAYFCASAGWERVTGSFAAALMDKPDVPRPLNELLALVYPDIRTLFCVGSQAPCPCAECCKRPGVTLARDYHGIAALVCQACADSQEDGDLDFHLLLHELEVIEQKRHEAAMVQLSGSPQDSLPGGKEERS